MSEQRKKNEKNFLVQGSILAIAGVITGTIFQSGCFAFTASAA